MRLSRLVLLGLVVGVAAACDDDTVTFTTPPPLAEVRYVNAVNDTGAVDIRMVDQVEWSANAMSLNYRQGTEHFPTEAKSRRIRVFLTSADATVTSVVMHEANVGLTAGQRVTLLLSGSARAGTLQFRVIEDDRTPPPAGQIAVRTVNASATGGIDAYYVETTTTAISGAPSAANVGSFQTSAYTNRATGAFAVSATPAGSSTVTASGASPAGPAVVTGAFPGAGHNSAGTKFSAYFFGPGVGAQAAVTASSVIFFVDRNPADNP